MFKVSAPVRKWMVRTALIVLLFGALHLLPSPWVNGEYSLILTFPPLVLIIAYDWISVVGRGRSERGDACKDEL